MAVNCREFLALLDADGADLEPAARAHAGSCAHCARAHELALATRRELQAMGDDEPAAFLVERVMARVRSESREPAPAAWRLRPATAAVAAVVLAVAGYALWDALRGAATPVREARSETALADKRERREEPPAPLPTAVPPAATVEVPRQPAARPAAARKALPNSAAGAPATAARETTGGEPPRIVGGVARPDRVDEAREANELDASDAVATAALAERRAAEPPAAAPTGSVLTASVRAPEPYAGSAESRQEGVGIAAARGKGARAAAAPATPTLLGAAGADATLVALVPAGREGEPRVVLSIAAVDAPPVGQRWTVRIASDGVVTLLDAAGRDIAAAHAATVAAVRAAGVVAGEYVLVRR